MGTGTLRYKGFVYVFYTSETVSKVYKFHF